MMAMGASKPAEEKRERLLQAAVEILRAAPGHSLKVVLLNKALFYLDLCSLRDTGDTVTGNTYVALERGPVVADYPKRLVGALAKRGIAEQTTSESNLDKPVALKDPNTPETALNGYAKKKAHEVAGYFAKLTSAKASRVSHSNPGWKLAYSEGLARGSSPKPINLRIAMQEIVERDPWIDDAADQKFEDTVRRAEQAPTTPWSPETT